MDLKDAKLIVVVIAICAGLGYLMFYSPWRPNYGGPAPNYGSKPKNVGVEAVDRDDPRLKYQNERSRSGR